MSPPLLHSESSLIFPASSSTSQDETSLPIMELPDPNRFTSNPKYIEPSPTSIGFSSDVLNSDQLYWTGDTEILDPDEILMGDNYLLMFDDNDQALMQFGEENVIEISETQSQNLESERHAPVNPVGQFLKDPKSKRLPKKSEVLDNSGDVIKKNKMSPEEAKRRKQLRDCLRQKTLRENVIQKINQEKINITKLKNMIEKKAKKIADMKKETEDLKSKLLSVEIEIQAVQKLSKEKVKSEAIVKEKFKIAHKHHLVCKRK
eukprot:GFUD01135936.1.p1 GENE.GFUD01135936.1~~GFUD01135936.1.p1  ORF type:complete len:261 (-),score=75.84 GFUD01135936.1:48-830(-)